MRDVREQLLLGGEQRLDALGHLVEPGAELADLVVAAQPAARRQLAGAERARGPRQLLDRPQDPARRDQRADHEHEQAEAECHQRADQTGARAMDAARDEEPARAMHRQAEQHDVRMRGASASGVG